MDGFTVKGTFPPPARRAEEISAAPTHKVLNKRILILTVHHGAAHARVAKSLQKALLHIQPDLTVVVADGLQLCTSWFRAYYNSYLIPLRYWPALWGWIESFQHESTSTGPLWLYRRGAQPLFQFVRSFDPDVVIVTEVGMCELITIFKRETRARFHLVGAHGEGVDVDRPWAQPEVDLYPTAPGEIAAQLEAWGVSPAKILPCGMPIDPAFGRQPHRETVRTRLGVGLDSPLLLVLFGGMGFGKPRRILPELRKLPQPLQVVFIAGKNKRLEDGLRFRCAGQPRFRVLGWVDNMHEWMAAANLLLSKVGGATVMEAINSGLPLLAFDPLPGLETRACHLIEKWKIGYWVKRPGDLAPAIARLLSHPEELQKLRENALKLARPQAAHDAAVAILNLERPVPRPGRGSDDRCSRTRDGRWQSSGDWGS